MNLNIPEQIKITRRILKENQTEFGKRFDVTATAVSLWEKEQRQAPYEVTLRPPDGQAAPLIAADNNQYLQYIKQTDKAANEKLSRFT